MRQALRPAPEKSKPPSQPIILDHPANAAVLKYFQAQYPEGSRVPSYHPDVYEYMDHTLPQQAAIKVVGQAVFTRRGLIHPASKVIFAVLKDEGIFGLRMSATDRAAALALPDGPKLYPEVGDEWIRFPLFSYQNLSSQWLAQAYHYAATL
jgi:hypothetical protein